MTGGAGQDGDRGRVPAAFVRAREWLARRRPRGRQATGTGAGADAGTGVDAPVAAGAAAPAGPGTAGAGGEAGAGAVAAGGVHPGADPAPLGWFLLTLVHLFTAVYTARPAPGEGLFGAAPEGGPRMAAWLIVVPSLFAGLYTGLTRAGRGWLYPLTFAFWPLVVERGLLYLFGMAGQWMLAGFPAGWREASRFEAALAFTRETLAPFATPAYVALAPAGLGITVVTCWLTGRLHRVLRARWHGFGAGAGLRRTWHRFLATRG